MGSKTKKQHYVPRFYLKNFTSDGSKIFVYDKVKGASFESNIMDAGQERYFYGVPELGEKESQELAKANLDQDTMLEHVMQMYDGICAEKVDNVLRNIQASRIISRTGEYLCNLSEEQKLGFSVFAAIQDLRTKETREKIAQMNHLMFESVAEFVAMSKYPDIDMSQYKIQTREDLGTMFQGQLLLNQDHLEGIARVCTYGRIWMLGVNRTATPFILSDHPIIRRSHDKHPLWAGGGWASAYLEVGIPLTPELMVMLFCPGIFEDRFQYGREWSLNNTVQEMTDENVMYYNSLQCSNSYRFLYSSTNDWTMVEKYLSEFPRHRNPTRQKVQLEGFGKKWELHEDWRMPKPAKKE